MVLEDLGFGSVSGGLSNINWARMGLYFVEILYFSIIATILGVIVWIFVRYRYRVHIWETRNEKLVFSKDFGREITKKDGKIYFKLFWRKKLLPPINYNLITSSTQKFFGKPVITLVQTNVEGYSGIRPRMTNEIEIIGEINKLIDSRQRAASEEESEDMKKMIDNRLSTLKNLSNSAINNALYYDGDKENYSGYMQMNPESAIKTFALESVDLGIKNNYLTIGEKIDSYKQQSYMDKYGNLVINLAVFAFSMVMFIIVLQKTGQITAALGQVAESLRGTANQINPAVVRAAPTSLITFI